MLQSLKRHVCENGHYHIFKVNVEKCESYLQFNKWKYFTLDELDEVLACMQDSDRYISEGLKSKLIRQIEIAKKASQKNHSVKESK